MEQAKRASGVMTGKPSKHTNSLPRILASIDELKQGVLSAAGIEDHAECAGFRRGRYGKWHCGVHEDKNPSCTVRKGRIKCWVCDQSWNVIDLEMLTTGQPFMKALRALANEYGIRIESGAYDPAAARRKALERQEVQERAINWQAGLLALADDILAEEKAALFDAADGSANESLIRSLTGVERILRETESNRVLVTAYDAFHQNMPSLTGELVAYGERLRYERQAALMAFIDLMAEPEDRW